MYYISLRITFSKNKTFDGKPNKFEGASLVDENKLITLNGHISLENHKIPSGQIENILTLTNLLAQHEFELITGPRVMSQSQKKRIFWQEEYIFKAPKNYHFEHIKKILEKDFSSN